MYSTDARRYKEDAEKDGGMLRTLKYSGGASSSLGPSNGSRVRDRGWEVGSANGFSSSVAHKAGSAKGFASSTVLARMMCRPPTSSTRVTAEYCGGGDPSRSGAEYGGASSRVMIRQPAYSRSAAPRAPEMASMAIDHAGSGPDGACVSLAGASDAVDDGELLSDCWGMYVRAEQRVERAR